MKYNAKKVANYVSEIIEGDFTVQELNAIGKVITAYSESRKEAEYLEEYLQTMALSSDSGGTMN